MSSCCTLANGETKANEHSADGCAVSESQSSAERGQHCPVCGAKGKVVSLETVKAMLAVSLALIQPTTYRFCRTEHCPVVYFAADGRQTFGERDLRERVHQKHAWDDDVFVCYCFRHTPGTIEVELLETGASSVVEAINAGIQAGQCACEIRNPQGSCCLGNVRATVKRLTDEIKLTAVGV
ncbi:MAG TPA: hypothetical protein VNK95_25270 [Caldilineaceae bacterium]|nr:hypothetical protein [Caldilineaceae bacterium]